MRKNLIKNSVIDIFTGKIPGKHKKASKIKTLKSLKFQRLLVLDRGSRTPDSAIKSSKIAQSLDNSAFVRKPCFYQYVLIICYRVKYSEHQNDKNK